MQNRNVDLLHEKIKVLQNESAQKKEIIKPLIEIQLKVFDSLSAARIDPTVSDLHLEQQQKS